MNCSVMLRPALFVLAALVLPGCAISRIGTGGSTDNVPSQEFRGHYSVADGSWFIPCGGKDGDRWWATATGSSVVQVDRAKREGRLTDSTPVFVRWLAVQTTDGKVGPRGPGKPALLVRDVLQLRPAQPDDCR